MTLGARTDPYLGCHFLVEVEGLAVAGFSEVSGLQGEVEVEEFREGGLNAYVHRRAGPARYPANLVLRRGLTDSTELWDWHRAIADGIVRRRNGSVVLLDATRTEAARWNFFGAYPVRWGGPDLRADSGAVAIESIELAHNGLRRARRI